MKPEDRIETFKVELHLIWDGRIRTFAEEAIKALPDYFFETAVSSTGKFNRETRDLLIAALLIHDGRKSGEQPGYTKTEHPLIQADSLRSSPLRDLLRPTQFELICRCVESHMGQWNRDYKTKVELLPKPRTSEQFVIHLADYLASRKMLEVNFEIPIDELS